jgi:hypothetical protein
METIGWFVLCQFAVPFVLHSLVFTWKEERFVSHLVVYAAFVLAPALSWVGETACRLAGRAWVANLYPLMVHVNLFGGGYLSQVQGILRKFT